MKDLIRSINSILDGTEKPPTYGNAEPDPIPKMHPKRLDDDEVAKLAGKTVEPENPADGLKDPDEKPVTSAQHAVVFSTPVLGMAGDMFAMGAKTATEWVDAKLQQLKEQLRVPAVLREVQRVTVGGIEYRMWVTGDIDRDGARLLPDVFKWNPSKRRYEASMTVKRDQPLDGLNNLRRLATDAIEKMNGPVDSNLKRQAAATRDGADKAVAAGELLAGVEAMAGEWKGKFARFGIELSVEVSVDGEAMFVVAGEFENLMLLRNVLRSIGGRLDAAERFTVRDLSKLDAKLLRNMLAELKSSGVAPLGDAVQGRSRRVITAEEWAEASDVMATMTPGAIASRRKELEAEAELLVGVDMSSWLTARSALDQLVWSRGAA